MAHQNPEVARLIELAAKATAGLTNPITYLSHAIQQIDADGADPYLLIGALLEGAAHVLARTIPPEKQGEIALAMVKIMVQRFGSAGIEPD